ncbi:malto-oligosyltrehalose synthase [Mycolicibacterium sp. YH-1]|uniref:malto-oligosyltrehalose synthase n=1 Tax=Mycolicibacterium sp. YH-1 TaxID=2908837 RepID=UPI001F4C4E03|nr:malto-oligosyltrehalose synthase [Mycolicibacterium sp. YH-1]UNB55341.1 malto-oligosyltrehalose synthase [Mycolicibacterium sp. YH-1]
MPSPILSTYRLQLRGPKSGQPFTFADAENLLDYLDDLGVSHLYLSPILTAAEGSSHGYDVTDPTTVSAELGGAEGLARLSAAARVRGIGLIVDIVPNHVGVDDPRQNRWWWDLLTHGRESLYATYFDVDWELDPNGRIVLPVLGSDDDVDDLVVDGDLLRLGDRVWPIAPGTAGGTAVGTIGGTAAEVHGRQNYRLISWRANICGYRRFFSITSLAALRQEDRAVFDATHVEVKRWFDERLVDGVRIDHPDGLSDPPGYLTWLRETTGPDAWIVIEKILAGDEALDLTLPVAGTTGYDALREIGGLFVDPTGTKALTELADSTGDDSGQIHAAARTLKAEAITGTLHSEVSRLRRAVVRATGDDHPDLIGAIAELVSRVGVYRSDYPTLASVLPVALAQTAAQAPHLEAPLALVATAVATNPESATRLQQLCGAATAKSMEDCLFYRDARLVSLNEVGGEPAWFGVGSAEFHDRTATRGRLWPAAMTTLSTHDTKRGEDVRARIGVLSQVPSLWTELIGKWTLQNPPPDPATALFLWQNVFGVWPIDGDITAGLRERLHAYAEKAIREAAVHTSWNAPNSEFESAVHTWLDGVLAPPVATEMTTLVGRLDEYGRSDALGQKLIALTAPGVPDVYQGTELWEDSLVDPDNRRPVDFRTRRAMLRISEHPKLRVTAEALRLRRERPDTFLSGDYRPVLAGGTRREHVVAFQRGDDVLVAVSRWTARLAETGWGDTALPLPDGDWTDRLTGRRFAGTVGLTDLYADLPVALLAKTLG